MTMRFHRSIFACVVFIALSMSAQQSEYASLRTKQWMSVDPPSPVSVSVGKTTDVHLSFRVNEGMHINSHTPSNELLIPTTLNVTQVPQFKIGAISYPKGADLALPFDPTEKLSVYTGTVNLVLRISVPTGAKTGVYTLHAEISYQACNDRACFPPRKLPVEISVTVN